MDRMVRVLRRGFTCSIVIILFSFGIIIGLETGPIDGATG